MKTIADYIWRWSLVVLPHCPVDTVDGEVDMAPHLTEVSDVC